MAACQNLLIRFTTASFTSPTADASVCTAKKLISARSSQGKPWESKKSKKVFGWSALWSTISATSIWRKKLCSLSTTLLAQKCNLCLRYDLSPMSPGRTVPVKPCCMELNPRPERLALRLGGFDWMPARCELRADMVLGESADSGRVVGQDL